MRSGEIKGSVQRGYEKKRRGDVKLKVAEGTLHRYVPTLVVFPGFIGSENGRNESGTSKVEEKRTITKIRVEVERDDGGLIRRGAEPPEQLPTGTALGPEGTHHCNASL